MNIAYEKRYQDWQAQYEHLFAPENHAPQQDEQFQLTRRIFCPFQSLFP